MSGRFCRGWSLDIALLLLIRAVSAQDAVSSSTSATASTPNATANATANQDDWPKTWHETPCRIVWLMHQNAPAGTMCLTVGSKNTGGKIHKFLEIRKCVGTDPATYDKSQIFEWDVETSQFMSHTDDASGNLCMNADGTRVKLNSCDRKKEAQRFVFDLSTDHVRSAAAHIISYHGVSTNVPKCLQIASGKKDYDEDDYQDGTVVKLASCEDPQGRQKFWPQAFKSMAKKKAPATLAKTASVHRKIALRKHKVRPGPVLTVTPPPPPPPPKATSSGNWAVASNGAQKDMPTSQASPQSPGPNSDHARTESASLWTTTTTSPHDIAPPDDLLTPLAKMMGYPTHAPKTAGSSVSQRWQVSLAAEQGLCLDGSPVDDAISSTQTSGSLRLAPCRQSDVHQEFDFQGPSGQVRWAAEPGLCVGVSRIPSGSSLSRLLGSEELLSLAACTEVTADQNQVFAFDASAGLIVSGLHRNHCLHADAGQGNQQHGDWAGARITLQPCGQNNARQIFDPRPAATLGLHGRTAHSQLMRAESNEETPGHNRIW